jgi:hypothetical protein
MSNALTYKGFSASGYRRGIQLDGIRATEDGVTSSERALVGRGLPVAGGRRRKR